MYLFSPKKISTNPVSRILDIDGRSNPDISLWYFCWGFLGEKKVPKSPPNSCRNLKGDLELEGQPIFFQLGDRFHIYPHGKMGENHHFHPSIPKKLVGFRVPGSLGSWLISSLYDSRVVKLTIFLHQGKSRWQPLPCIGLYT